MHKSLTSTLLIAVLVLADAVTILTSMLAAHRLRLLLNAWVPQTYIAPFDFSLYIWPVLLMLGFNFFTGLYTQRMDFWEETRKQYRNLFFLLLTVLSLVALAKFSEEVSRLVIMMAFALMLLTLPLSKLLVKLSLSKTPLWAKEISEYGDRGPDDGKAYLFGNAYMGYRRAKTPQDTVLIDTAALSLEEARRAVDDTLHHARQTLFVPLFGGINLSESTIHDLFDRRQNLISIRNNLLHRHNLFVKKLFELLLVLLAFPLLLLPFTLLALLIKLDSNGPVFFFQPRIGRYGQAFNVIKFRTMFTDNEVLLQAYLDEHPEKRLHWEAYHKLPDDPRITRVGRFLRALSLDELPQFINVLRGDMNLIGPRPYMLNERKKLEKSLGVITAVAPGITGLWQVSGRNALTFEKRVELDEWYIRNWSLWMDFVIFLKTFDVVLRRKGIF